MNRIIFAATFCAALAAGTAVAADAMTSMGPHRVGQTALGSVLVDGKGMTLYTFDKDMAGKSACNDQCARNWPPLMAPGDAGRDANWSVVTRDDGTRQWAYKGKPVYGWVKDAKAGDTTGDGVNGVWRVARP